MKFFKDPKPYTAISQDIERLLEEKGEDPARVVTVLESIQANPRTGGQEAGRVLRKKLKYGQGNDQLRALSVTDILVSNGGKAITPMVTESGLGDVLAAMASHNSSVASNSKANTLAQSILLRWTKSPNTRLHGYFAQAGLKEKGHSRNSSAVSGGHRRGHSSSNDRYQNSDEDYDDDYPPARGRPSGNGSRSRDASRSPSRSPSPINLRSASLTTTVATAHSVATRLTNSLILVDKHPRNSRETKGYYRQCKQLRHKVVELIHSPNPEVQEFLDQLLQANQDLVAALQAHDAVMAGGHLSGLNDHSQGNVPTDPPIEPLRPPPSRRDLSNRPKSNAFTDSDEDDIQSSSRSSPHPSNDDEFNPFADDNKAATLPTNLPIW